MAGLLDASTNAAFGSQVLLLGLATTRFTVAMVMMPLFAPEIIPALVRNSMMIALALVVLILQPPVVISHYGVPEWLALFSKEAFIGIAVGVFFGSILWALGAAGQIIDTKVGATTASLIDPLSGHQTALTGAFFARMANFVFIFSGGFLFLVNTIMQSFAVWPVAAPWPDFKRAGVILFENEFGRLMMLSLLFAAPSLVVMFAVDVGLGLINRYAQQLNVFSLSMSIKSWLSTLIIVLMLGSIITALVEDLAYRNASVMSNLHQLLGKNTLR